MKVFILSILVIGFCGYMRPAIASQQQIELIDKKPQDYTDILAKLCADKHRRISRPSTILGLAKLIGQQEDQLRQRNDIPGKCIDLYKPIIGQLADLVTGQMDKGLCGNMWVNRMMEFHWKYVACRVDLDWSRTLFKDESQMIPQTLFNFFIDFSNQMTNECIFKLSSSIKRAISSHGDSKQLDDDKSRVLGSSLALGAVENHIALVTPQEFADWSSFNLIWQSNIDSRRLNNQQLDQPCVGLKTKDPAEAWDTQAACRQSLRPVYLDTTLPVMKLIQMGYGIGAFYDVKQKQADDLVKEWYFSTQLCEFMLGLSFHQDQNMAPYSFACSTSQSDINMATSSPVDEPKSAVNKAVVSIRVDGQLNTPSLKLTTDSLTTNLRSNMKLRCWQNNDIFERISEENEVTPIDQMLRVLFADNDD